MRANYTADDILDFAWDAQGPQYEAFAAADGPEPLEAEEEAGDDVEVCAELRRVVEAADTLGEVTNAINAHKAVCLDCLYAEEPKCNCHQTDVDMFDARVCELHDAHSQWNRRHRSVTAVERLEQYLPEVA